MVITSSGALNSRERSDLERAQARANEANHREDDANARGVARSIMASRRIMEMRAQAATSR